MPTIPETSSTVNTVGGFPAEAVRSVALELCALLAPGCLQIEIAGSLRRGKPTVKDIEIVACLRSDLPSHVAASKLDARLLTCLTTGLLQWDTTVKRRGERYKRFVVPGRGVAVDLFIADESNFGNIFAIRTGDADFTKLLVTSRNAGGLMHPAMRQDKGNLWRLYSDMDASRCYRRLETPVIVPCPTEEDFFQALGLPLIPPSERNLSAIAQLRKQLTHFSQTDTTASPVSESEEESALVPWWHH